MIEYQVVMVSITSKIYSSLSHVIKCRSICKSIKAVNLVNPAQFLLRSKNGLFLIAQSAAQCKIKKA